jgi:predicted branched-subunit amino acid permease
MAATLLRLARVTQFMNVSQSDKAAPHWTMDGFRLGAWEILPLLPGVFAFGMAFGTAAAQKGFSLLDTFAMSATVFAGMAQFIVLESWPDKLTLPAIAGAGAITAIVCLRFLLISASLRPWAGGSPPGKIYPTLYLLTESNWLLSMRYRADGGRDPAYLLGSGVMTWIAWVLSSAPGYLLGASIGDPRRAGLDLVMPVFFCAMLVPLWRGSRRAIGWAVGGAVALVVDHLCGGVWYVIAGALAGSVAGGFIDD